MVSSSGSHPENVGSTPARNEIYFPFFGSEERVFAVKPKPTRHSDITTKVWYYHDSNECFSYTTKFIVKDFCVVVITLNAGNFNNYQHGWKRDNLSVRCRDSFVAKNLDQAINEYDTRLREYVDDNYGWDPCDWELSYSVA